MLFISQIPLEWMLPLLLLGVLVSVFDLYLLEYFQESFKKLTGLSCAWLESAKYPAVTGAADKAAILSLSLGISLEQMPTESQLC